MESLGVVLFCMSPFLLFLAGWMSCYFLLVKYRFRMERREEFEEVGRSRARAGLKRGQAAWEP